LVPSSDEIRDIPPAQAQPAAVGKCRDEFSISVEKPPSVDRRQVRDAPAAIESDRVPFRRLLGGSALSSFRRGEVQDISGRLVRPRK
jgi:hypothetical protein